jgi:hypothetical protein
MKLLLANMGGKEWILFVFDSPIFGSICILFIVYMILKKIVKTNSKVSISEKRNDKDRIQNLEKLWKLKNEGVLTETEFQKEKNNILNNY